MLDHYLWLIHGNASFCGTYTLLEQYPPERAAPVINAVLGHERVALNRHEMIRAISRYYEDRNEPIPGAMLPIFEARSQDSDPEVRKLCQQCLADREASRGAEPAHADDGDTRSK